MRSIKRKPKEDEIEVLPLVKEAIKKLPYGEERLDASEYQISKVCRFAFQRPDIKEIIWSSYSMGNENPDVGSEETSKEYAEEIQILEEIVSKNFQDKNITSSSLGNKSAAMKIWEDYGIAWRAKSGLIYVIWQSQDLFGTPIIHAFTEHDFAYSIINKYRECISEKQKVEKKLASYKNVLYVIVSIGALVAIGLLSK
jgi:hypothetical protein